MANSQTKAATKYQEKMGIISKNFKIKKALADDFKATCERMDAGRAVTLLVLVQKSIDAHPVA